MSASSSVCAGVCSTSLPDDLTFLAFFFFYTGVVPSNGMARRRSLASARPDDNASKKKEVPSSARSSPHSSPMPFEHRQIGGEENA